MALFYYELSNKIFYNFRTFYNSIFYEFDNKGYCQYCIADRGFLPPFDEDPTYICYPLFQLLSYIPHLTQPVFLSCVFGWSCECARSQI